MSLYRNQLSLLLLLLLMASPLLHSDLSAHAAPTSPPITPTEIQFETDANYEDDVADSIPPKVPFSANSPVLLNESHLCDFDPCRENQAPCSQLSSDTGCLCPGRSGLNEPPRPPVIQSLRTIGEGDDKGKVEVLWCAPSSPVSVYRVKVERSGNNAFQYGQALRRGLLGYLEVGTKVCVEALNSAGRSHPTDFSCTRYNPPKSSEQEALSLFVKEVLGLLG